MRPATGRLVSLQSCDLQPSLAADVHDHLPGITATASWQSYEVKDSEASQALPVTHPVQVILPFTPGEPWAGCDNCSEHVR